MENEKSLDTQNGSASGDNAMAKRVADCAGKPDPKGGTEIGPLPDANAPYKK